MPDEQERAPQDNPAPPPEKSPYLLEAEDKDMSEYLLPAAIGVGGVALLYRAFRKKSKRKKKAAPEADRDQVTFSEDFSSYKIGKEWAGMVLEPYLAEQAEEGNLLVTDATGLKSDHPSMTTSRNNVLSTFYSTHHVRLPKEERPISELPKDRKKVEEFLNFVNTEAKNFQETY